MVTGSTVPGVAAGATAIFWRFDGTAEYLGPKDSGGMQRLSMRYLAVLRGLVGEWLRKRRGTWNLIARPRVERLRPTLSCLWRRSATWKRHCLNDIQSNFIPRFFLRNGPPTNDRKFGAW